jgi:hypothetical protein
MPMQRDYQMVLAITDYMLSKSKTLKNHSIICLQFTRQLLILIYVYIINHHTINQSIIQHQLHSFYLKETILDTDYYCFGFKNKTKKPRKGWIAKH